LQPGKKEILEGYTHAIRAGITMKKKSEWNKGGARAVELCQNLKKTLK